MPAPIGGDFDLTVAQELYRQGVALPTPHEYEASQCNSPFE